MSARLLIVDDSPTQLEALRSLLVDAGLDVLTATSGEEAYDVARREHPDLVLSDVMMPGMSGFDLSRKIKEGMGEEAPAVVLLTSLADPLDIVRGLEAGADNYITKPYQPQHLIQRVNWVLENRALRREGQRSGGLRIRFMGEDFTLPAAPEQMLEMLLGSFEDLAHTNRALRESQQALAAASARELEREQRAREEAERTAETMEGLARAAEAATRARDDVLATVSHDLRNPIGTIYTSAALLLDLPLDEAQRERQVQIIKRTAERMNRLIQDLLDASRMEAGHFSVEPQPITIRSHPHARVSDIDHWFRLTIRALRGSFEHQLPELDLVGRRHRRTLRQLLEYLAHARNTALHSLDRIIDELRLVFVLLGVLHDHRLLGDDVLQVVHQKSRQPVEGLELAALCELEFLSFLIKIARDLLPCRFQQIMIFEVEAARRGRLRQCNKTQQLLFVDQRHDETRSFQT